MSTDMHIHTRLWSSKLRAPPMLAELSSNTANPLTSTLDWKSDTPPPIFPLKTLVPLSAMGNLKLRTALWLLALFPEKVLQVEELIQYHVYTYTAVCTCPQFNWVYDYGLTHQSEKLVVVTTWSTLRLDTMPVALPPVGEELLMKVQLEKEAVFVTRFASSGTKLSYKWRTTVPWMSCCYTSSCTCPLIACSKFQLQSNKGLEKSVTLTCSVRLYAPPPTHAEFLSKAVFLTVRIFPLATSKVFMLMAPPAWTHELFSKVESVITMSLLMESL